MNTSYVAPVVCLDTREELVSPLSWYVVPLLILLSLSIFVATAVEVWCVAHGQSLVVGWHYSNGGATVTIACSN